MLHPRRSLAILSSFVVFALLTAPAHAAGSNMPWEQPLNQILESIQGPVAKVISVIVIGRDCAWGYSQNRSDRFPEIGKVLIVGHAHGRTTAVSRHPELSAWNADA